MRKMSRTEALEFLGAEARTGKVATATTDGSVHVAPLWFVVDGDDLVFVTTASSIKGRHLHQNPRAALAVDDDTFPYAFVTARGAVDLDDDPADLRSWTTRIATRYVPARADEFAARNDAPGETLVRLHAATVVGYADVAI